MFNAAHLSLLSEMRRTEAGEENDASQQLKKKRKIDDDVCMLRFFNVCM